MACLYLNRKQTFNKSANIPKELCIHKFLSVYGIFLLSSQNDSRLSSPSALHNSSMSACQYFINSASSQKCCIQTFENYTPFPPPHIVFPVIERELLFFNFYRASDRKKYHQSLEANCCKSFHITLLMLG